jgi:hypothetical protein
MSQFSQPVGGPLPGAGQFAVFSELKALPSPWRLAFFGVLATFVVCHAATLTLISVEGRELRQQIEALKTNNAVHEESATRWHKLYDELLERIGPTPRRPTGSVGSAGNIGKAP